MRPPVWPSTGAAAQLALATILQAYTGASDDEVLEATVMDRCWQRKAYGREVAAQRWCPRQDSNLRHTV
jgi:hypothetical protein